MTDTRTIVTVTQAPRWDDDYPNPVRYEGADNWVGDTDGDLQVVRNGGVIALWARGTWARAELTEEPVALQLTDSDYTAEALTFAADVIVDVMGNELEPGPIADLVDQLRHDADAEPAEPEQPDAGPGTFEVYEDATGNYRFNLRDGDGEYLASGQGYAIRKNAHAGVAAVQRAAKDAPIIDLEHE